MEVFEIGTAERGIGAVIHDVMCYAAHRLTYKEKPLFSVKGDRTTWFTNGKGEMSWNDFFLPYLDNAIEGDVVVWPNTVNDYKADGNIERNSEICKKLCQLTDRTIQCRDSCLGEMGFKDDDVLLHIRRTDKIKASKGSVVEAGELSVKEQVETALREMQNRGLEKSRLFVLTDDISIYAECESLCKANGIEFTFDKTKSNKKEHIKRMQGKMTKEQSLKNIYRSLAYIEVMRRCKLLIGGRYTYLFRIGELLRYPLPSVNLKDSDVFDCVYADPNQPPVNPLKLKRYIGMVDSPLVKRQGDIWIVSNFLSEKIKEEIRLDLEDFDDEWYTKAILPALDKKKEYIEYANADRIAALRAYAKCKAERGEFAYSFSRTLDENHFETCTCIDCRMRDTVRSREFINALNAILDVEILKVKETFLSKYEKGDFLTTHHDGGNGDYTFIIPLTEKWYLPWGGLTHFLNEDESQIICSITPKLGDLVLFKVRPDKKSHHFVSEVVGTKPRHAYTGWFDVRK